MNFSGRRPISGIHSGAASAQFSALAIALAGILLPHAAVAYVPPTAEPVSEGVTKVADVSVVRTPKAEPKKPDLIVVPIPQSSPSLGTGITLGGGLFYNPNGSKEP